MINLKDLIPVTGRRYRKSLEILHSMHKAIEDAKGERQLAQRSLHHAMGDLAKFLAKSFQRSKSGTNSLHPISGCDSAMSLKAFWA
jgi:hypothetical protein